MRTVGILFVREEKEDLKMRSRDSLSVLFRVVVEGMDLGIHWISM
jgi:hypothetical protein